MNQKRIINKIIKFEGEYLNGKRWNGKGYNHEGKEVFEIRNGEGLIKEYNYKGKLILEAEYKNGEISGKAKVHNNIENLEYEGGYLKGKKMEKGKNIIIESIIMVLNVVYVVEKMRKKKKK